MVTLLAQMAAVLKPLQVATTVLGSEQNTSCSIIYPVINGLLVHHMVFKDDDLSDVRRFKTIVNDELNRRFKPSCLDTAKSLPVFCSLLDPRYSSLTFLNDEQKGIACEAIIDEIESLKLENDCSKQKIGRVMNYQLNNQRKQVQCNFS